MFAAPFLPSARERAEREQHQQQLANLDARLAALETDTPRINRIADTVRDQQQRRELALVLATQQAELAYSRWVLEQQAKRGSHGR